MRTRLLPAVALVLASASLALAAGPWYESYGDGVKAVQAQQWSIAEARLRAAKKDGPAPGRQVRAYGVRFIDYFPDYYLGVACFHQEKWREASEAFRRMEATGLLAPGDPEQQTMSALAEKAAAHLVAAVSPSPAPATPATPAPTAGPPHSEASRLETVAPTAMTVPRAIRAEPTPRAVSRTDAVEEAGVHAFFQGRYEAAAQILGALPTAGRSPRGAFYLACSGAALAFLKGPEGVALVGTARAQFVEVRRHPWRPGPEERYISPRILALYRSAS